MTRRDASRRRRHRRRFRCVAGSASSPQPPSSPSTSSSFPRRGSLPSVRSSSFRSTAYIYGASGIMRDSLTRVLLSRDHDPVTRVSSSVSHFTATHFTNRPLLIVGLVSPRLLASRTRITGRRDRRRTRPSSSTSLVLSRALLRSVSATRQR